MVTWYTSSDNFKGSVTKILQEGKTPLKPTKRHRITKTNQMELSTEKHNNHDLNTALRGLNSRTEMPEARVNGAGQASRNDTI